MRLHDLQLITFDLDDTLWPCLPVIGRAEQKMYEWLLEHAPEITRQHDLASLREHRLQYAHENPSIAHDLTRTRLGALGDLMTEYGYPGRLAEDGMAVFRHYRNQVVPYDDVIPVLSRLKTRYTLVSVTNGNVQLEQTGLNGIFDFSLNAVDAGAARPDPALFYKVLEVAAITPEAVLHVGDHPVNDVEAAYRAGFHTAWMKRAGTPWPTDRARAEIELEELTPLLSLLMPEHGDH